MGFNDDLDLREKIKIVSGEKEREVFQQKLDILRDMDERNEARREKRHVLADLSRGNSAGLLPTVASLTAHEKRNYSVTNALLGLTQARQGENSLEKEISLSIEKDIKQPAYTGALWIPLRVHAVSGLDTLTNGSGKYTVGEKTFDVIDYLQNQTKVLSLGAQMITGLRFAPTFPVENTPVSATWVSENSGVDVAESEHVFGYRQPRPHSLQCTTSLSRQLLQQNSVGLEIWLRRKLAAAHGVALDRAAIHGSGLENQPIGLLKTANIGDVPVGTDGGAVTAAHLISLEKLVGDANADSASLGFLTNSLQRSKLRAVPSLTSGTIPVWGDSGLLGYRTEVSNQVSRTLTKGSSSDCSAVIFGSWSQMLLLEWNGAIMVLLDEYRLKKQGMLELSSFGLYDTVLAQPAAFAAIQDAR